MKSWKSFYFIWIVLQLWIVECVFTINELHHAVVVDAGSTGTRANYYIFKQDPSAPYALKLVSKTSEKVEPGLSSYGDNVNGAVASVSNLLRKLMAKQRQPMPGHTELDLEATAGMRLLKLVDTTKAQHIIDALHSTLKQNYTQFHVCDDCVIISRGVEEGLYSFITINTILGLLNRTTEPSLLHGVLEMGGASTQIAIPLSPSSSTGSKLCPKSPLPNKFNDTLNGQCVYVKSYFPLGVNLAEYVLHGVSQDCITKACDRPGNPAIVSPCFHHGFQKEMNAGATKIILKGDSSVNNPAKRYDLCYSLIKKNILEKKHFEKLSDHPILFKQPIFIISAFYYALKAFKGGAKSLEVSLRELSYITRLACNGVGNKGKYEPYFCFRLAYFESLFRDGYGFPEEQLFIAASEFNGVEIDWTYAAAIEIILGHSPTSSLSQKQASVTINVELEIGQ